MMIKTVFWLGVFFMFYKIVDDLTCVFGSHVFVFGINEDRCQKCGIGRKRVRIKE